MAAKHETIILRVEVPEHDCRGLNLNEFVDFLCRPDLPSKVKITWNDGLMVFHTTEERFAFRNGLSMAQNHLASPGLPNWNRVF